MVDEVTLMRRLRFSTLMAITATLSLGTGIAAHDGEHEGGEVMVISGVVPGSAAEEAGLVAGDRIAAWEGQQITTQGELNASLDAFQPGDEITLTLSREGQTLELPLTFGSRADGGVSIGVSLGVASQSAPGSGGGGFSPQECMDWIDETYRLASMAQAKLLDRYAWSVPTIVGQHSTSAMKAESSP